MVPLYSILLNLTKVTIYSTREMSAHVSLTFQSLRWAHKFIMSTWFSLETNTQQKRLFRAPRFKGPVDVWVRCQSSLCWPAESRHTLKSLPRTENCFNSTQNGSSYHLFNKDSYNICYGVGFRRQKSKFATDVFKELPLGVDSVYSRVNHGT